MTSEIPVRWVKKVENTLSFEDFERALKGSDKLAEFVSQRNQLLGKVLHNNPSSFRAVNNNLRK